MKIQKTKTEIVFTFPRYQKRYNPYMEEESEKGLLGEYPIFTGLIIRHRKDGYWDEMGFAQTIDMDYKDKPDQVGQIVVAWFGEEEDFKVKCKELEIDIQELEF